MNKINSIQNVEIITGDLLTCDADIIVQQCNCLTVRPHGLSEAIGKKFPEANFYQERRPIEKKGDPLFKRNVAIPEDRSVPGTVIMRGRVACLMAQWRPGKVNVSYASSYPESVPKETDGQREKWFAMSLVELEKVINQNGYKTVAFPFLIGCGLAGGSWPKYLQMITDLAERNPGLIVNIIKLP